MAKFKLEDGTEIEAFTAEELQEKIDTELAGLKAKRDELLGLHAKDKERLTELEKAQQQAEEERQREKGEFKTLYENVKAELEKEREQNAAERRKVQERDIALNTSEIVSGLTADAKRAAVLKKEVTQFAKYTEDGVKYEIGGVEVDAEKVKQHLSAEYPFLVDGDKLSGGGALGGSRNGQGLKNPFAKGEHFNLTEQGRLLKENPAEAARLKAAAGLT